MLAPPKPHHDLQAALAHAISGEPPDAHLAALKLSLLPAPPHSSVYEIWRGLTLSLAVDWPLGLLMHSGSLARQATACTLDPGPSQCPTRHPPRPPPPRPPPRSYAELFRFLLLVKRVQLELHAAWASQTQCARLPAEQRALLMPLWRLRAHMVFLIDNLQYYLQV